MTTNMDNYMEKLQEKVDDLYNLAGTTNRELLRSEIDYLTGYIQAYFEMRGEE